MMPPSSRLHRSSPLLSFFSPALRGEVGASSRSLSAAGEGRSTLDAASPLHPHSSPSQEGEGRLPMIEETPMFFF